MPGLRAALVRALIVASPLPFLGASCGPGALGVMPGVLNDPHNRSLRKAILAYGQKNACAEVSARSMPIRPRDDAATIGRFVPLQCYARETPNGELYLQLGGRGYVWTSMSQRVGFESGFAVSYDTDFLLDGSTMYVYFRPRSASQPGFITRVVENPQAAFFGGMATAPNGQKMTDAFGASILSSQMTRGFTVIRKADGSTEVGLGVIPPGMHPMGGLTPDRDKVVLLNDRSELHQQQRDYVPLDVPAGSKITVMAGVEGAQAIDLILIPKPAGEAWLGAYATQAAPTPPPAAPVIDEAIPPGAIWRRTFTVPPGAYYLVLDNTATAGRSAPIGAAEQVALVSYAVELE